MDWVRIKHIREPFSRELLKIICPEFNASSGRGYTLPSGFIFFGRPTDAEADFTKNCN
jgi:hypothetical protein